MDTTAQESLLVSRSEAARILGVSRATVIRLVQRGTLEEIRLSAVSHPRFRRSDLLALVRAAREGP
jgi:excisionase family DNA binding protein